MSRSVGHLPTTGNLDMGTNRQFSSETGRKLAVPLAFLVFSALLVVWLIPNYVSIAFANPNGLNPRFFPYMISAVMAALAAGRIVSIMTSEQQDDAEPYLAVPIGIEVLVVIAVIYGCYFLFGLIGMMPASIIAMMITMLCFRIRNPIWVIAYSVFICVLLFLFFEVLASVPIPRGIWLRHLY